MSREATALRGRELQRPSAGKATGAPAPSDDTVPIPKSGAMGIAKLRIRLK